MPYMPEAETLWKNQEAAKRRRETLARNWNMNIPPTPSNLAALSPSMPTMTTARHGIPVGPNQNMTLGSTTTSSRIQPASGSTLTARPHSMHKRSQAQPLSLPLSSDDSIFGRPLGGFSNLLDESQWQWPQQAQTSRRSLPLDPSLEPPSSQWLSTERQLGWAEFSMADEYAPPSSPLTRLSAPHAPIVPDNGSVDPHTIEQDLAGMDQPALPPVTVSHGFQTFCLTRSSDNFDRCLKIFLSSYGPHSSFLVDAIIYRKAADPLCFILAKNPHGYPVQLFICNAFWDAVEKLQAMGLDLSDEDLDPSGDEVKLDPEDLQRGMYRHASILFAVKKMWFDSKNNLGITMHGYFNKDGTLPHEIIVLAAIAYSQ
ncbi:hypothetical protein PHLCEN_2v6382 [Hermanssonia centrifuga]|uniref:DUF6532 domain-containing protein n=1 Tax=Hermanssonia centrifuga TaxID=98765 RepID=A0A2R6NZN2_9APHY|nr:hypothetical protein PHLCEN_2v6382 [Hermanssonia centrifuga]